MDYYDDITDIDALLFDLGTSEYDMKALDDVLSTDISAYDLDVDRSDMPSATKASRVGMAREHLAADISLTGRMKVADNPNKVAEAVADHIVDEYVRSVAWDKGASKALDVGATTLGETVFGGKKSKVAPKQKKGSAMSFEIDMTAVDDFIIKASKAVLFTRKESNELKDIVYDKTAVEMTRAAISDFLIEEYRDKSKDDKSNEFSDATSYIISRYNYVVYSSKSIINKLITVSNNSLSKYRGLNYASVFKNILEESMTYLAKWRDELHSIKAMIESSMSALGKIGKTDVKDKGIFIGKVLNENNLLGVKNSCNELLVKIDSLYSTRSFSNLIKEMDFRGDFQYRHVNSDQNIFEVIRKGVGIIISRVEEFEKIVTEYPLKADEFGKIDKAMVSGINLDSIFVLESRGKKNNIMNVFKIADDADKAFMALGIDAEMIKRLKSKISNVVFNRGGLDNRISGLVRSKIITNFMRAIS